MDYGKKESVDLSQLWIMVPDKSLVSLPSQAVHCMLAGVTPVAGIWHEGKLRIIQALCF